MGNSFSQDEERVLLIAPTAKDAQLSQALFGQAGLVCAICRDLTTLVAELACGAGVLVLTEEVLAPERRQFLVAALAAQPTWSSLPIIILASAGPRRLLDTPLVQQLGNVLVLERPISTQTLLSVVQLALRLRRRQYQVRLVSEASQLLATSLGDDGALTAITALLAPRLADCCLLVVHRDGPPRVAAMAFAEEERPAEQQLRAMLEPAGQDAVGLYEGAAPSTSADLVVACLQSIGATPQLVVPLEAQGHLLGSLGLGMLTSGRMFLSDERQVVQDVAGRVALALNQDRLYRAERAARAEAEAAVRSRDELIAVISHDLNSPLTTVLGQAQLLQRQMARKTLLPERVMSGLSMIARAAQRMQAQIAELLDSALLGASQQIILHREATDLIALTQAVVETAQQTTERHQISMQTQLPVLVALVDPVRIERVLDNLLSNAVKYSPDGGPVTVAVDCEEVEAEVWAVVRVQDRGIGIPAADIAHVFERFRRASNVTSVIRGTGLGLASVRQIVEEHGGQVAVVSSVNGGSLITMRLPLGVATQ
ncbi:MAG TPA: HAMP domain-containing sensor histidine kinase [Roseiflexaceae bacterium]|nr:HAMP domain-containing sensor histidine kinase [Roseiflexaceae bacterium]